MFSFHQVLLGDETGAGMNPAIVLAVSESCNNSQMT